MILPQWSPLGMSGNTFDLAADGEEVLMPQWSPLGMSGNTGTDFSRIPA